MQRWASIGKGPAWPQRAAAVCYAHLQNTPCPVLLPDRAAGAFSLQAGRAPVLPAPGFSSAGCSWGQAGLWKACLIRHFAIWHQWLHHGEDDFQSGSDPDRTVLLCVTWGTEPALACTGENSVRLLVGFRVDRMEVRSEGFGPRGFAKVHGSSRCPNHKTTVTVRNWHSANVSKQMFKQVCQYDDMRIRKCTCKMNESSYEVVCFRISSLHMPSTWGLLYICPANLRNLSIWLRADNL